MIQIDGRPVCASKQVVIQNGNLNDSRFAHGKTIRNAKQTIQIFNALYIN